MVWRLQSRPGLAAATWVLPLNLLTPNALL